MYELEIESKLKSLPEDAKKEVLDFIEFLAIKSKTLLGNQHAASVKNLDYQNPFLNIAGFYEIGEMNSIE
jgi:hypothetical protein